MPNLAGPETASTLNLTNLKFDYGGSENIFEKPIYIPKTYVKMSEFAGGGQKVIFDSLFSALFSSFSLLGHTVSVFFNFFLQIC